MSQERNRESGATLVELVITIAIMSATFAIILGVVSNQVALSSLHRKQATSETVLRSFAEAVKSAAWSPTCSDTAYEAAYSAPAGFTRSADCTVISSTLQRISLSVDQGDGTPSETVDISKRDKS